MNEQEPTAGRSGAVRRVTLRVDDEELRSWKVAAAIRDVSLSEWMRRVLTATATKTREDDERRS
jgi:predicted HicB family RNase H-like nuclease